MSNIDEANKPLGKQLNATVAAQRAKAAERMRRHRARRKRHCRIVAIEVGDFDIVGLVRLGLLEEKDREDVVAVGDALYRLFDETIATG